VEEAMKIEGRCHCGEITYEAVVKNGGVSICHCSDCQMLTGSAFRTTVPAARESFVLRSGQPKIYVKTADSGTKRAHAFCPNCGSPVYSAAVSDPQFYSLRVGCLRERAELPPVRQQWCQSALPWAMNLQSIQQLQRQ
jgi:hypothetical protein